MTQIVPDGEAIRIKMSEALAEIEAHVYTLESTLKVSIKANGQFVAEIITVKAERDAALARVSDLETALKMMVAEKVDYMDINNLGDRETQHTIKYARAALTKDQSNG